MGGVELLVGEREAKRFVYQIFPLPRPAALRMGPVSVPEGVELELELRCASGGALVAPLPVVDLAEAVTTPLELGADCDFGLVSLSARKTRARGGAKIVEVGALAVLPSAASTITP